MDDQARRLSELLAPYHDVDLCQGDQPDPARGWFFRTCPPDVARMALGLVRDHIGGWRPNGQPPATWLVDHADALGGTLAGSVYPQGPGAPRLRIDTICIPAARAALLADRLRQWTLRDEHATAADIAVVEGWAAPDSVESAWVATSADVTDRLDDGVAVVTFWWD